MNKIAYRTTGLAIKTLSGLSKARIRIHAKENIPDGPAIFVINHFTRIETLIMPYQIYRLTDKPTWSLADYSFFKGAFGSLLDKIGAVSTKDPDRDRLLVKSLLTGEANWIIYPEGRMVKNKKIVEKGRYMISYAGGKHPPHTGAATLALRAEFYRQRLKGLAKKTIPEFQRLLGLFQIESMDKVSDRPIHIVPVNMTYYPLRARENLLSKLTLRLIEDVPERLVEELMTEGAMLLSGVDVDIRIGKPIDINPFLSPRVIQEDISSPGKINFDDSIRSKKKMRRLSLDIMQRYMAEIYCMTTVNHDHLFASILRMTPRKKMDVCDLTRKVYFAATMQLEKMGVHCHDDLKKDQVHLLTDDRFNKRDDFLAVAIQKQVVRQRGSVLEKADASLSTPFDFHRIRIDNPVGVMANEIEPLCALQRRLRIISWTPAFLIRRKIAARLKNKAVADYKRDYRDFYHEGESKEIETGMPLLYKKGRDDLGIVLVHGYMAAPPEVKALAVFLANRKYTVYAPRLRGHGTSPDDLAIRTYQDWIASVEEGYALMRCLCRRIVLGGFSTGAGLALDLAERVRDVAGVFAVCPPMRLQDISSRLVPAVDVWNRMMKKIHLDSAQKTFVENNPENPHINYFRNPISGIRELERLMESIEPRLQNLKVPALVVQSQGDPVVNPEGSRRAFEMLGSENKEYRLFNFKRHGILLGEGSRLVHSAIGEFIARLR